MSADDASPPSASPPPRGTSRPSLTPSAPAPQKFGFALVMVGLSFVVMALAASLATGGRVSVWRRRPRPARRGRRPRRARRWHH
ncbi:hypothetical protein DMB42_36200 [Nonomuraea sp. WAC 01424]|uniref:hypothetical protein n=1 Tax=Nonomuraea sp. WAC 01424 TaxID=2203200 RepID=UPI000F79E819|nr:hypothetical protein [Nonomuraea sp. WAC 01424]RSN02539.1 hypothetical protein DMB42_36200 [Nonomuraea sp. WAC 01424]